MSFFTTSDGQNAAGSNEFQLGGGDIAPIPKGTRVLAAIDETKVDDYEGKRFVNNRWNILQPAEFAGRKVFQKLHCWDLDTAKRDKAIRMLAAIDTNAGGKIAASGQEPDDMLLQQSITNKPMVLDLEVWEINGKTGNWVSKVSPRAANTATAAPAPQQAPKPAPAMPTTNDDDVPF